MIKIKIVKYMTIFDLIKKMRKDEYYNKIFKCDDFEGNIDDFFKKNNFNTETLNKKIEIVESEDDKEYDF